jgi:hypothetical protein
MHCASKMPKSHKDVTKNKTVRTTIEIPSFHITDLAFNFDSEGII